MLRKGVVCAALLASVTSVQAADWVDFDAGHVSVLAYDKSSIVKTGKLSKVWMRETFTIPQSSPLSGRPISKIVTRFTVNCQEHSLSAGESISYYNDAVVDQTPGAPTIFQDSPPDSVGDHLTQIVCRK